MSEVGYNGSLSLLGHLLQALLVAYSLQKVIMESLQHSLRRLLALLQVHDETSILIQTEKSNSD